MNNELLKKQINTKQYKKKTTASFFVLAIFYLIISPGIYVSKFIGGIGLLYALFIVLIFFLSIYVATKFEFKFSLLVTTLFAAILPNQVAGFLILSFTFIIYIIDLLKKGKLKRDINKNLFIFILYLVVIYILYMGRFTDIWSLPLYSIFYVMPITFGLIFPRLIVEKEDLEDLFRVFIFSIFLQFLPLFFKPFVIGDPGLLIRGDDLNHGTTIRAHYLGVLFVLMMSYQFFNFIISQKKIHLTLLLVSFVGFLLTDSKHIWAGIIPGIAISLYFVEWKLRLLNFKRVVAITFSGLILFGLISQFTKVDDNQSSFNQMVQGVTQLGLTNKVIFFLRTSDYFWDNKIHAVTGLGPGSYGSRVASARAQDVLYKSSDPLPSFIPSFSSGPYAQNIAGLYTEEDANALRSKVLHNPFADIIGIFSELGLIGSFLYLMIYVSIVRISLYVISFDKDYRWKSISATAIFIVPCIIVLSLFSTYLAKASVIIPIWFLFGLVYNRYILLKKEDFSSTYYLVK